MPATFIMSWLQHFAFEKDVGPNAVTDEPFTKAYFEQKLAPFRDATNPNLTPFEKAGGKLIAPSPPVILTIAPHRRAGPRGSDPHRPVHRAV